MKNKGISKKALNDMIVEQGRKNVIEFGKKLQKRPIWMDVIKQSI